MSKGAGTFTTFTFAYSEPEPGGRPQYDFTYVYEGGTPDATIVPELNKVKFSDYGSTAASGTLVVQEALQPLYFAQGTTIVANVYCVEDDVLATAVQGVFQRATNSNNIYLGSNITYLVATTNNTVAKSVILPPVNTVAFQQFTFKFIGRDTQPFSICPYMSNITYPLATSQFTATAVGFGGIFDSDLNGAPGNFIFTTTAPLRSAVTLINNGVNWQYANIYNDTLSILAETPLATPCNIPDKTIVFNQVLPTQEQKSLMILPTSTYSHPIYLFCQNATGNEVLPLTIKIFAPLGVQIDSIPVSSDNSKVEFSLAAGQIRTIGFYYNIDNNRYYILSDTQGSNLASTSYPETFTTLTKSVGYVNGPKNIQLPAAYASSSNASMNTILFTGNSSSNAVNVCGPNSSYASFIIPSEVSATVSLSNQGIDFCYTFASFLNNTDTNIIPLYSYSYEAPP
jgi:hypothetical protein